MALRKIRRLLRYKITLLFAISTFFGGCAIYIGEKVIAANPEFIPVKAQIRSFINNQEYNPIADRDIGFLDPPNVRHWVYTEDYQYLAESDNHGFPNRMPLPQTAEIEILGDSLVSGAGVGIDGEFSTLIGGSLPNVQVVNFGLGGEAPNRQLRVVRKFGASLRPKLVVSCIYLVADLDGQLQFDAWLKEGAKSDYNQFRLKFGDNLHPKSFWTRVQRKSYLAGKFTEVALRWWGIPDRINFSTGPEVLLDIDNLRLLASGLDRQDLRLLSLIDSLKEMATLAQHGAAKFLVVLIPSKEEIYGARFMPEVLKPEQILEQRLVQEGFSVLSVYDVIRERAKNKSAFFPHDIHLNAFGNEIVADALVDRIKKTKFLANVKDSAKASNGRDVLDPGLQ
jgi:acetyltransferase AlgX (SGNH hydrolase-like protein)